MKNVTVKELKKQCLELKKKVIHMIYVAQSGHPGGSLSAADFVTAAYFSEMNIDPKNPRWVDRRSFCPVKRTCMPDSVCSTCNSGIFPRIRA